MKSYTIEELREMHKDKNLELIRLENRNVGSKGTIKRNYIVYKCLVDGYEGARPVSEFNKGKGCAECGKKMGHDNKTQKLEDIVEEFKDSNFKVLSLFRVKAKMEGDFYMFAKCKCNIDGEEWDTTLSNLRRAKRTSKPSCPKCNLVKAKKRMKTPKDGESFGDKNKEYVKFFKNREEAFSCKSGTHTKFLMVCPNCGKEKSVRPRDLVDRGFSCSFCGDGFSKPEKFFENTLRILNINYTRQYKPEWSGGKLYDFYLMDYDTIVELHGEQHYKEAGFGRPFEFELENDRLKLQRALENSNSKYIVVNCSNTRKDSLIENILKEFEQHPLGLKIKNINEATWNEINVLCSTSKMKEACDLYNSGVVNLKQIAKELKVTQSTVRLYLQEMKENGLCDFDEKLQRKIGVKQASIKKHKEISQYDLNNKFIKTYQSLKQASEETGICFKKISSIALGTRSYEYLGFIFKYSSPNN